MRRSIFYFRAGRRRRGQLALVCPDAGELLRLETGEDQALHEDLKSCS